MSKEFFKCLLAVLYFILGTILTVYFILHFNAASPAYILTIILGLFLIITGFCSFILHYKNHLIIKAIKEEKLSPLAKWSYIPSAYTLTRDRATEDYHIDLSIIMLIGILGLIVSIGFIFSNTPNHYLIAATLITLSVILSSLISICISIYHNDKLEKETMTIITDKYIYYDGTLYSLYKSCYALDQIEVIYGEQNYLQFNYGIPGTTYDTYQKLIIPIPKTELPLAQKIQSHYLELIH